MLANPNGGRTFLWGGACGFLGLVLSLLFVFVLHRFGIFVQRSVLEISLLISIGVGLFVGIAIGVVLDLKFKKMQKMYRDENEHYLLKKKLSTEAFVCCGLYFIDVAIFIALFVLFDDFNIVIG